LRPYDLRTNVEGAGAVQGPGDWYDLEGKTSGDLMGYQAIRIGTQHV
jgi:hypothetical protein